MNEILFKGAPMKTDVKKPSLHSGVSLKAPESSVNDQKPQEDNKISPLNGVPGLGSGFGGLLSK